MYQAGQIFSENARFSLIVKQMKENGINDCSTVSYIVLVSIHHILFVENGVFKPESSKSNIFCLLELYVIELYVITIHFLNKRHIQM